jgi:uncharacterized protein YcgI (DUF1989 family)
MNTEDKDLNKAIDDLTIAVCKMRDVMNYLQKVKLEETSITQIETTPTKVSWWKKIFSK